MKHWRTQRPRATPAHGKARPRLEALEDRAVPATLTVNTLVDDTAADGKLSLREAVSVVNNPAVFSTLDPGAQGQISGTFNANDTITFDSTVFTTAKTITMTGGQFLLSADVTITGTGAKLLTIDADQASRVFVINTGVTAKIGGLTIANGSAGSDAGGGISNLGTLELNAVEVVGGVADRGGAVNNEGTLRAFGCTFAGNQAQTLGGGMFNFGSATAELTNCTFSENKAAGGGGIASTASLTLLSCTVNGNEASVGGGVAASGPFAMTNTVVGANNKTGGGDSDISGTVTSSGGFNLTGFGGSGGLGGGTDLIGFDPRLSGLADNGGPVRTMLPASDSPVLDKGGPTGSPATDARGFARPSDLAGIANVADGRDIGAVEVTALSAVVNDTSDMINSDAVLTLREAVALANGTLAVSALTASEREQVMGDSGVGGTITFDPTVFGTAKTIGQSTEYVLTHDVTITGPGARLLTLDADGKSRHFRVDNGVTARIEGMTLTHGQTSGAGGSILNNGTLTVNACAFLSNTALFGGGIANTGVTLEVTASTFVANSATAGGGLFNNKIATVTNCTFSSNSADSAGQGGGGILLASTSTSELNLIDCTLSGNSAIVGGGIRTSSGTLRMTGTIVAGNVLAGGGASDIEGNVTVDRGFNLIGDAASAGGLTNANNNQIGINPLLGPLNDYGGPVQTFGLRPGSPAIDAGTGTGNDARGVAPVGQKDIGAFESKGFTIAIVGGNNQTTPINTAFVQPLAIMVQAVDPVERVSAGVVTFTAPVSGASSTSEAGNPARVGIPSNGATSLPVSANGISGPYQVTASARGANTVTYNLTNIVAPPANLVVDNTGDASDGDFSVGQQTLREAIERANLLADANIITFDPTVFGTPKTIGQNREYVLMHDVTITGPEARLLTLDADGKSRHFTVDTGVSARIEGITLVNGSLGGGSNGGSILNNGTLMVNACAFQNNNAFIGGGVYNFGNLTISQATFSSNSAELGGAVRNDGTLLIDRVLFTANTATVAGAISNDRSGTGRVTRSTFTDNVAEQSGAIQNTGATFDIVDSTFTGNRATATANGFGGAVTQSGGPMLISGSTFSGNKAGGAGGGAVTIYLPATIINSTFVGNETTGPGGAIYSNDELIIRNSTITGNRSDSGGSESLGATGGGLFGEPTATTTKVSLFNTIVAGNVKGTAAASFPSEFGGTAVETASNHNLVGDTNSAGGLMDGQNGNIVGKPALLGPLADNGGPTRTHALLAGSPAIDAGTGSELDQRGVAASGPRDIGAYELSVASYSGEQTNQAMTDKQTLAPFATLSISQNETFTVHVAIVDGVRLGDFTPASAAGWQRVVNIGNIRYARTFTGSTAGADAQAALRALVFDPKENLVAVGQATTTSFVVRSYHAGGVVKFAGAISARVTSANDAPTGITLSASTARENAKAGTLVGLVSGTDPDFNPGLRFALINNAGGRFRLIGNRIEVAQQTPLDFEQGASHVIRLRVTDASGASFEKNFTISLINETITGQRKQYRSERVGAIFSVNPANGLLNGATSTGGRALQAQLVTAPRVGQLTLRPDGSFTLMPPSRFRGTSVFTFRIWDGKEYSANQTCSIVYA